MKTILFSRY